MKRSILFFKYGSFEVAYMFVMIIYMAQATPETSRMVGSISGNPIPLLLPIVLTYILWKKHPISFNNKKLHILLTIYTLWAFCSLIKYDIYTTEELSYHVFMIYAIIIAYIHNQVFRYKLLPIYENILVILCKIAIIGWIIAVLIPDSASFFRLFPETRYGNHVLYLFNWMDPAKGQIYAGILRNAGCSWEPGRFAIMVTLAIFCNLCQNGIKFKSNKNILWLLIALATTQSTTGYFTAIILYLIFAFKRLDLKNIMLLVYILIPICYVLFQFDFMSDKISSKITAAQNISRLNETFSWHANQSDKGKYLGSIDRFDAMVFEWLNLKNDPLLGYSRNVEHSYFTTQISSNYVLANGLVKILSMYGIFMGLFFFYILLRASINISKNSYEKRKIGLFVLLCLSAISYQILSIPIFTTFWFYNYFGTNNKHAIYKNIYFRMNTKTLFHSKN